MPVVVACKFECEVVSLLEHVPDSHEGLIQRDAVNAGRSDSATVAKDEGVRIAVVPSSRHEIQCLGEGREAVIRINQERSTPPRGGACRIDADCEPAA
jgi:hypothetical protein